MQNHIETVIFDLDGTLRHSVPSADDIMFGFSVQLGIPDSAEGQRAGARWAHYYWAQSDELLEDVENYDKMEREFWVNYAHRYLMALDIAEKQALKLAPVLSLHMEEEYHPQNTVNPDGFATLQALRDEDYTIGLISNRTTPCHDECRELGLLQFFDFAYVASEVNAWKPDPAIFDRALQQTGNPPESILYIGDNYFADIIGAQRAGLQPVLLDPNHVFPEAQCTVINSLAELRTMLIPRDKKQPRN